MKNIKDLEGKMITKEKFMKWLNEPNSQPLSLKQFGSCYTYLKAPQNDDFLYYSAGVQQEMARRASLNRKKQK